MGILNLSPDSFSDGGLYSSVESAEKRSQELAKGGAAIIDIGGESTAPGSKAITSAEELSRINGVVMALAEKYFLSVDTYHSATAADCLMHGAKMINDVSGLRADKDMASVLAEHECYTVIMHSKEADDAPHASSIPRRYTNIIAEIGDFLLRRVDYGTRRGIKEEKIILDPGIGRFISNDPEDSWSLLAQMDLLVERLRPFPLLIGISRKGFLGGHIEDRDAISQLCELHAVLKGVKIIRTHNPRQLSSHITAWEKLCNRRI